MRWPPPPACSYASSWKKRGAPSPGLLELLRLLRRPLLLQGLLRSFLRELLRLLLALHGCPPIGATSLTAPTATPRPRRRSRVDGAGSCTSGRQRGARCSPRRRSDP